MIEIGESGLLLVDKPYRWTSFDVVNRLRHSIKNQTGIRYKIGHTGTLDPLATGLLLVCYGKETKNIESYMNHPKEYIATLRMGATTPCYDLEKPVDVIYPYEHITQAMIEESLTRFKGEILQAPPTFSAKQVNGKRAYKFARKGNEIEMLPVLVTIYDIELLENRLPELVIRVVCGRGTYIRAIARDLGKDLLSGAHLTGLRRTRVGEYSVEGAIQPEEFKSLLINK